MILNLLYFLMAAFAIIVIMLFLVFLYKKNSIQVNPVIAGPITNSHQADKKTTISPFETYYYNGKKVNPRDYTVCKVDGDCMGCRGIHASDIIFIKKFKNQEDKKIIKKGDILYIKYFKNGLEGYKLREIDEHLIEENAVKTLYYTAESDVKYSSRPHKIDNIVGIVAMKFNN